MPGNVPERWEKYDAYKSSIKGTRFIAFKVPLEQRICQRLPKEFWLTPDNLIKSLEKDNFKIGIVIDLTNTKRYYKVSEIESLGVKYAKIYTEGHIVPSLAIQEKFAQIVNSFLEENADNDLLVGVHCTHGLNRTGYMVCRYMINHMNFNPKDAIDAFNEARGYTIERENYIEDLMNISRSRENETCSEGYSGGRGEGRGGFSNRGRLREVSPSFDRENPKKYWTKSRITGYSSRGRGYENYSEGYSGGRGEGHGGFSDRGRLWQVGPSFDSENPKEYRPKSRITGYSSRGRGYETYSEGYSGGRGEGRGGFSDRGRLRQVGPSFDRENPKEYRPKSRITGYSSGLSPGPSFPEESARFKERDDRSFHSRGDSPPPAFRKRTCQEDDPPPSFRKKRPAMSSEASSDLGNEEEVTIKKQKKRRRKTKNITSTS